VDIIKSKSKERIAIGQMRPLALVKEIIAANAVIVNIINSINFILLSKR